MPDRRNIKTKNSIRKVFLSQLKYKNLNQITVTKIANLANIGRGTFYLHYLDVADLYNSIVNELFSEFEKFFDNAFPTTNPDNLKKLMEEIIGYISENKQLFLILLRLEGSEKTISKLKKLFNQKVLQETIKIFQDKDNNDEYLIAETTFIISGIVGLIDKWLSEGLVIQNDKIISILHEIIMKFN